MHVLNILATAKLTFLTPDAKNIFNYLYLVFIKTPIFQHFDLENHIQIKIVASNYAINRILSQLNIKFEILL